MRYSRKLALALTLALAATSAVGTALAETVAVGTAAVGTAAVGTASAETAATGTAATGTVAEFGIGAEETQAERIFSVRERGRYAVRLEGDRGASVDVVDRMHGVLGSAFLSEDTASAPRDFSAFFDPGDYKLRIYKREGGRATVIVERFRERPTVRSGAAQGQGFFSVHRLGEKELVTFPVSVAEGGGRLTFLALGRTLGGMTLLRSGTWETGVEPFTGRVEAEVGKPASYRLISAKVEPGEYTVVCWGAPGLPWSGGGGGDELYVMEGERRFDDIGLHEVEIGGSGFACLSLPPSVDFAQAAAISGGELSLSASPEGRDFIGARPMASTDGKPGSRAATLSLRRYERKWLVVRGAIGSRAAVRFFPSVEGSGSELASEEAGTAALRVLASAEAKDSAPISAFVAEAGASSARTGMRILADSSFKLTDSVPLRLQANLLDSFALYLDVAVGARYVVQEKDPKKVAASWEFSRFQNGSPYLEPVAEVPGGTGVELPAGRYLLRASSLRPGFLEAAIVKDSLLSRLGGSLLWGSAPAAPAQSFSWSSLYVPKSGPSARLLLFVGASSYVPFGASLRRLPAELADGPLSIRLLPGERTAVRFLLAGPSRLRILGDGGTAAEGGGLSRFTVKVDGAGWNEAAAYGAGLHELSVESSHAGEKWILAEALPVPAAEAAAVAVAEAAAAPVELSEGKAVWDEYPAGGTRRFEFSVETGGFYVVETTGRLQTGIALRDPLRVSIRRAQGGGAGRNARILEYLKPGRYQVEATALGRSAGQAGVSFVRSPVRPLAALSDGSIRRATAAADEALVIPVKADKTGEYRIDAWSLDRDFSYRLEDSGGWPVREPVANGSFRNVLRRGEYVWYSFPDPVPTRRVFSLTAIRPPAEAAAASAGKDFPAEFGRQYQRSWRGPGPDTAALPVPVAVRAFLSLSDSMAWRLVAEDGTIVEAGFGSSEPMELKLPAGRNRLEMEPAISDEDHGYDLWVSCDDLFEGRSVPASVGAAIPVAIGRPGYWSLTTSGRSELDAALFRSTDGGYKFVASARPIADDWNCAIALPLEAGRYVVKIGVSDDPTLSDPPEFIEPGSASSTSSIRLSFRSERRETGATGSFERSLEAADAISVVPFVPGRTAPYLIEADGGSDLSLERDGLMIAAGGGRFAVPLQGGGSYLIRCSRSAENALPVVLRVRELEFEEKALDEEGAVETGKTAVLLRDPTGRSRFADRDGLLRSDGIDVPFAPVAGDSLRAAGSWLADAAFAPIGRLTLRVLSLSGGDAANLPLARGGQRVSVEIPLGSVGLLVAEARGRPVSLSVRGAGSPAEAAGVDWSRSAVSDRSTVLGLAAGTRTVDLRDSVERPDGRRIALRFRTLPVTADLVLVPGSPRTLTVPPASAVAVTPGGSKLMFGATLEKGLSCFTATDATLRTFIAADATTAFETEASGVMYILNEGSKPALASLELFPASSAGDRILGSGEAVEAAPGAAGRVSVPIRAKAPQSIVVAGTVRGIRFFDEATGIVSRGERAEGPGGLSVLVVRGTEGRLEVDADAGWYRVSVAADLPAAFREGAFRDGALRDAASSAGEAVGAGRTLEGAAARAWALPVDGSGRPVYVRASGSGVLAILDGRGGTVAFAAGTEGQALLLSLPAGSYSVVARPFLGSSRSGTLAAETVDVETRTESGEGGSRLLAPFRFHVYSFRVSRAGRVGVGVRAESDGLSVRLTDAAMRTISEGPLFLDELEAGVYNIVVEAREKALRYAPVWIGLEGENHDVPEGIVAAYMQDGE